MANDSRNALNRLMAAFETHYNIATSGVDIDSAAVENVEEALRDAFFTYDDLLFTKYGVELPFDMLEEDSDILEVPEPSANIWEAVAADEDEYDFFNLDEDTD